MQTEKWLMQKGDNQRIDLPLFTKQIHETMVLPTKHSNIPSVDCENRRWWLSDTFSATVHITYIYIYTWHYKHLWTHCMTNSTCNQHQSTIHAAQSISIGGIASAASAAPDLAQGSQEVNGCRCRVQRVLGQAPRMFVASNRARFDVMMMRAKNLRLNV